MSDHRERSSLFLWFFPSQSRPAPSEKMVKQKKLAEPASIFLRSHFRHSPSNRNTRCYSQLLHSCFSSQYAVNESGAEPRGKENEEMGARGKNLKGKGGM